MLEKLSLTVTGSHIVKEEPPTAVSPSSGVDAGSTAHGT